MRPRELFTLTGAEIKHETERAVLVEVNGEDIWLPLSQIEEIDHEAGEIIMTAWIAKEKGLI